MAASEPTERKSRPRKASPNADEAALGLIVASARVALSAARLLSRTPGIHSVLQRSAETGRAARVQGRQKIEHAAQSALSAPEVERLVDGALASPLPETVARSTIDHHLADRLAVELESEAARLMDQFFDSPEFERALERALSSPRVRSALAHTTTSLAEEMADDMRSRAAALDQRLAFGRAREAARFGGAASRTLAFVIDLVAAHLLFLVAATFVALVVSLVGELRPVWLFDALAGAGWALLVGAYFVFFWTLKGQTPGMRIFDVRVVDRRGDPPGIARAIVRFGALLLSIIPLFAGLIPILFDRRRRGLQDLIAGTEVQYAG
jgi:uncharacterized RDD family membrane protein YckC